ncbi:MAG: TlpA disulfide reductase family protein [Candidatus Kapaibacterium sp.]
MMIRLILLACFLKILLPSPLHAQTAQEILSKAYSSCQSIKSGSYSMTVRKKFMTIKDTSISTISCTFQKSPHDTISPLVFHSTETHSEGYTIGILYTGKEFVRIFPHDSTAELMPTSKWAHKIPSIIQNFFFFRPLTDNESAPLQHDADSADNHYSFIFIGKETTHEMPCYHVKVLEYPEPDAGNPINVFRVEYQYWIRTDTYLPIRYTISHDVVINNDTMHQHEDVMLNTSAFNSPIDTTLLTLNSIATNYRMRDFVPTKAPPLLPNDTLAPDWTLSSVSGTPLKLRDYSGKLVLLDFFYRSCAPCMLAIPGLQALHTKYYTQGLRVIGINPIDKNDAELRSFLTKSDAHYPIALDGADVAKAYHVSSYPTLYLIDSKGTIIYSQVGFSKDHEAVLEKIIVKNLGGK